MQSEPETYNIKCYSVGKIIFEDGTTQNINNGDTFYCSEKNLKFWINAVILENIKVKIYKSFCILDNSK